MDARTRRYGDTNLASYAYDLLKGERVTPLNRLLCLSYAFGYIWWGRGLLFQADSPAYLNPVFNGVFTAAHPSVWGLGFWCAGCLMLLAAITARGFVFLVAVVMAFGILFGWAVGVIAQSILDDDAILTSGAIGLYILSFTGLVGVAFSPRPLEHQAEIFERVGGEVRPLRSVERRTG